MATNFKKEFGDMVEGYKNLLLKNNEDIENLSKNRMGICKSCVTNNEPNLNKLNICKLCDCFMPAATRAEGKKCPLSKW